MDSRNVTDYILRQKKKVAVQTHEVYSMQRQAERLRELYKDIKSPQLALFDIARFETDFS